MYTKYQTLLLGTASFWPRIQLERFGKMIRLSGFRFHEPQWSPLTELPFELPRLQAHRGYWVKGLSQNSLASVLAAHKAGFKMVELDLRLNLQKDIVLAHDPVLDSSTLTTLTELLSESPSSLLFNLEIKNESKSQFLLEEKLVHFLKSSPHRHRVLFSSFNPFSLAWMAQLLPEIPRALLVSQENQPWNSIFLRELSFLALVRPHFLHLRWEDLDHYKAIPKERKVVWTLNDPHHGEFLIQNHKVASLITDSLLPQDSKDFL